MPFVDTNSHPTTKPSNFDIKCQSNSETYEQHNFFGTKFKDGQNFLLTVGGFYNEREYSGADLLEDLSVEFTCLCRLLIYTDNDFHLSTFKLISTDNGFHLKCGFKKRLSRRTMVLVLNLIS